ncbi:hypothetical protein Fmac_027484 [Flemingia macrophylla]|uniref:Uncharacterized protein n=1 Tax=Flemingia macrophylla TaxID=520843 RepID=A0ABD1LJH4_9FABA
MLNQNYKCAAEASEYQDCNEQDVAKVTTTPYSDSEPHPSYVKSILDILKKFWDAFFLFTSPYAILGQTLGVLSASLHAVEKLSDISPLFLIGVLQVAIPFSLLGIFVAGLNQLTDIEIDKINKPYLPLASGKISYTTGSLVPAFVIGSRPLILGLVSNCLLWMAYSVNGPFLRWKKNPFLAAMCLFSTLAIVFPISSFLHMQTFVFKRSLAFPKSLISAVIFMTLYSIGIAFCKDVPDVEGDEKYGVYTFAVLFGRKRMFQICVFLFEMAFGVAFLAGATSPFLWIKLVTGVGHVILASVLWYQAKSTDLTSKSSMISFYFSIWKVGVKVSDSISAFSERFCTSLEQCALSFLYS